MLVRLNQLDPRSAEGVAGWTTGGCRGSIAHAWPASAHAYQLEAADVDEHGRPVPAPDRHAAARRAGPAAVAAIARPGDMVVVRLDGPFGPGLLPAVVAAASASSFAIDGVQRLTVGFFSPPQTSVRLVTDLAGLTALCADEGLALSAGVRLRAVPLPAAMVDPMLDTADVDDERWPDLLAAAAGLVSTAADLCSVVVWANDAAPDVFRERLAAALAGRS